MKNTPTLRNLIGFLFLFGILGNMSGCGFFGTQQGERKPRDDLWGRVQDSLVLQDKYGAKEIRSHQIWYQQNQAYLDRIADRGSRYLYYIIEEVEHREMPGEIALLPIIESAFQPFAYSPSHASGIWQFIPATGERYGLKQNWWYDGRRDIQASTKAALDYLQYLHHRLNGDWLLAVAAYNAGEGNVEQAVERNRSAGKPVDFWSLDLPKETLGYVPRLLALASIVQNPTKYGLVLKEIPNHPYFQQVSTFGQIELSLAAKIANLSVDEIRDLNPAFEHWATDPDGPHYLLLPVDRVERFQEGLARLSKNQRIRWHKHVVKRGESLSIIATRFKTTATALQQVNSLTGNTIRVGQYILIPDKERISSDYPPSIKLAAAPKPAVRQKPALKQKSAKKPRTYTVRAGDSLWIIARQYGVSIAQLVSWNDLSRSSVLIPGQKLKLYGGGPTPEKG